MPAAAPAALPPRLLDIIRSEFQEMPDLHLTRQQFRRLWALTDTECDQALTNLLRAGFLVRDRQERYRYARARQH